MSLKGLIRWLNHKNHRLIPQFSSLTKLSLFVTLILSCLFLSNISLAQDADPSPVPITNPEENLLQHKQEAMERGTNQEGWLKSAAESNAVILLTSIGGTFPFNPDGTLNLESYRPGGIIGTSSNLVASLYNSPASGVNYMAQLKDNFLGTKTAYAQGAGFVGLQPLLPLWRAFRNVVYILSSIFFIVIGIMIILRVKISPQAVITLQNALPKVILSLILVTFSYAIAGFIIDLVNLIQGIVIAIIFNVEGRNLNDNLFPPEFIQRFFSDKYDYGSLVDPGLANAINLTAHLVPIMALSLITGLIGALIGSLINPGVGTLIGGGVGLIITLTILLLIVTFWIVKLFFGLIKAYLNVIISIIFAPIVIGIGAFPNSKTNFSSWLTSLIANISIFPATLIFLVLANYIIFKIGQANTGALWIPSLLTPGPDINNLITLGGLFPSNNLLGGLLPTIIGFAALGMLSKLPDLIPQVIFQLKPSPFGQAIGQSYHSIIGLPAAAAGTLHSITGFRQDLKQLFGKKEEGPQQVWVVGTGQQVPTTTQRQSRGTTQQAQQRANNNIPNTPTNTIS